jgi:YVTN family beta-propeller protein
MKVRFSLTAGAICAVSVVAAAGQQLQSQHLGTLTTAEGAAEIITYDASTQRLYVTDALNDQLDIYQTSPTNGAHLTLFAEVNLAGAPNSVAVKNGLVAVAVEAAVKQDPGQVQFFDLDGNPSGPSVTVGALPDMIVFTPDGTKVLTANEAEADVATGLVNPEGSVSIVDVASRTAATASFAGFNASKAALQSAGVRLTDVNGVTVAQDVEPEYIAISPDGAEAYVTLQEANSVAVVDIASATVTAIRPLGEKDHSLPGNQLDTSDQDGLNGNFVTPNTLGLFMPDAIATFEVGGTVYYATANEGDDRGDFPGFNDAERGKDLDGLFTLDAADASPETGLYTLAELADSTLLGRLKFAVSDYDLARGDTDGDGDVDQLYTLGARSVTIWDAATGAQVFDSGDEVEQTMLANGLWVDSRSDDKGPEPEGLTFGVVDGVPLLFVGLERTSSIMVYDVTDPANASYVGLINLLPSGAISPEGLAFIPAADSATGTALLAVASEVSGSVGLYELQLNDLGTAYCFGSACPCGNDSASDAGCLNSTGEGAVLGATGSASVGADSVTLSASGCPAAQPGVFFSGDLQIAGGAGITFGDGLRCAGGTTTRLELINTSSGLSTSSVSLSAGDGAAAGQTRHYQFWFRDPAGSPCGNLFNTSNGLSITWSL